MRLATEENEMTKTQFIERYRAELSQRYTWAQDTDKLARFMASVETTLRGPAATWNHDGEAVTAAWRAIGGKGKPALKALRALDT